MSAEAALADLDTDQLRELAARLMGDVRHKQALIDKVTHENAVLKRLSSAWRESTSAPSSAA